MKIGMIGGFGPDSTMDYYRLLIEEYKKKIDNDSYPEIIIYSMDINNLMKLVGDKDWEKLVAWLLEGIEILHKGGAEFGFISANTPHVVFDRLSELSPIPLLSIVDAASQLIQKAGIKKIDLLGTKFTMINDFY